MRRSARAPEPEEAQPEERPSGRDRLLAALRSRPTRGQALVGVLLLCVGFAAVTQVRANDEDDQYAGLRQSELIAAFDGLAASTERAENEIARLEEIRDELQDSTLNRRTALEEAREQEAVLRILAGTVPTTGPGIRITIEDPAGAVSAAIILDMIQELRSSGAEAMEVNDRVRVVAQTAVEETSEGVVVGGTLVQAPYVIDVIGEQATLEGALPFPGGPIERVEAAGGTLTHERRDDILVEAVVEDPGPDIAQPRDDR
jgi:uncharacterized protein YlxW (UPF0749 family)